MSQTVPEAARDFVKGHIDLFHKKRLQSLESLKLGKILKRKNPYLFKSKNILTSEALVKTLLDAHLSSQEETIFGDFLEELAIFINQQVYGGRKSSAEGIDLEFNLEGIHYIISIKSGPNWGNSSQIKKMKDNFKQAQKILRTGNSKLNVRAVNGCCYGRENAEDKGDYLKLCGQQFWAFISGNANLYIEIIESLGYQAKKSNEDFNKHYSKIVNQFSKIFLDHFCDQGEINWDKLVQFNSGKNKVSLKI